MSDLVRALAFAFRRKGADAMSGSDLRMLLAYDLRWFAPEDAKRVVQRGLETGLLVAEGDAVRPAFDPKRIEIPLNFRPGVHVIDEEAPAGLPPPALAPTLPTASAPTLTPAHTLAPASTPAPAPADRAAEDERRRRGLLMSVEVSRLVVRRRAGEDVTADAARLEAALLSAGAPARP